MQGVGYLNGDESERRELRPIQRGWSQERLKTVFGSTFAWAMEAIPALQTSNLKDEKDERQEYRMMVLIHSRGGVPVGINSAGGRETTSL